MMGRDLERLRRMRDSARDMVRSLGNQPFQHPKIHLPVGEAQQKAAELEGWLAEIVYLVESELYTGPLIKE